MFVCTYMHKSAASQNATISVYSLYSQSVAYTCAYVFVTVCKYVCVYNGRREILLELCLKTADNNCIF